MKLFELFDKKEPEDKKESPDSSPEHNETDKEKLTKLFSDADENKKLNSYTRKQVFQIRPGAKGEEVHINFPGEIFKNTTVEDEESYIVRMADNVNKIKIIDKEEFEKKYEIINPNKKADAEGFLDYNEKGDILAFLYEENEVLNLSISGHRIKINVNDYVGYHMDDPDTLLILPKSKFEQIYQLS